MGALGTATHTTLFLGSAAYRTEYENMRVGFIIARVLSSPLISIQFSQQPGDLLKSAVFSHTVCGIAARDIKKVSCAASQPPENHTGRECLL
jgi:hypothetical protein